MEAPGDEVERRRREDRGAKRCRGVSVGRECPLSTWGARGLGRGLCAPSSERFRLLSSKCEFLVQSGTDKAYF